MLEDRVAGAQVLPGQKVDSRATTRIGFAEQVMAEAVRHEDEVARPHLDRIGRWQAQPAGAGRDDVEAHRVGDRRHLLRPRLGELDVAVEGTAHPQRVEHTRHPILILETRENLHAAVVSRPRADTPAGSDD
ncbi:hypothetical protein U6G28_10835 [Actinomycetaceae bacterium MB13-C1-2]|nr:hypothetical protein U6G28_10835 [Actinomycetaceae bacterium MB13-C1-2]